MSDTPTAPGAYTVILNQRSATAPYHREVVEIQGDEVPGKALGFDSQGRLGAIVVAAPTTPAPGFNVKSYGALGNNTGDDAPFIQAAVDAAETAGGGLVIIPCGTYRTLTTITVGGFGVVLQGESGGVGAFGAKGSVISYQGAAEAIVLGDRINEMQYGFGIRDLTIKGTAAGKCGIRMGAILDDANNNFSNACIRSVCITGFTSTTAVHPMSTHNSGLEGDPSAIDYSVPIVGGCAMLIHRGINCRVEHCDFWNNWIGVLEASHHMATTYSFQQCYLHVNNSVGLRLSDSVGMSFRDCIFESNKHQGVLIQPFASASPESCYSILFTGCYFENNCYEGSPTNYYFETFGLGGGRVMNLVMRDCLINPPNGKDGVKLVDTKAFVLDHVRVQNAASTALNTDATSTGMVTGPSSSASGHIQGLHVLGVGTAFLESYAGRLKLSQLYLENPSSTQLTVVNSPGNYYTFEVTPYGVAEHKTYGLYARHQFSQSILCVGDLESAVATNGIVLKSPNGHRWRFTVSDAGALSAGADLGT